MKFVSIQTTDCRAVIVNTLWITSVYQSGSGPEVETVIVLAGGAGTNLRTKTPFEEVKNLISGGSSNAKGLFG